MDERPEAADAARRIADDRYPDADVVILAGSVALGRATPNSDLDLVVVSVEDEEAPLRESFTALGWPMEAFVHTPETVRGFMRMEAADRDRGMSRMVSTGIVVRDRSALATVLRHETVAMIAAGPSPLPDDAFARMRYGVTDLLDDLRGDPRGEESVFIASALVWALGDLHLTMAGAWSGGGKWLLRELRETDPTFADRLVAAMRAQAAGAAAPLIGLAEEVLEESGGPLFDGYRASGKELLRRFEERQDQP